MVKCESAGGGTVMGGDTAPVAVEITDAVRSPSLATYALPAHPPAAPAGVADVATRIPDRDNATTTTATSFRQVAALFI